ncbi:metallo-beta-lactamase superfamily domain-containing protein [Ceratobasidium sp. AG-Ba]|nr:metallo-beta-lactamase superfamily domain-containing protein [Ceratobasidium sp. AG-Ba]
MPQSVEPARLPPWNIPTSNSIVRVSVIDTTTRVKGLPTSLFFVPVIGSYEIVECPAFGFLIEHEPSGKKLLFDLGVPKNWRNGPPAITNRIIGNKWQVDVEKDVSDILAENGVPLESINSIIWSHYHWDHTGDPSVFPSTTSLTVGPGFVKAMTPGYPTNPNAHILESAYKGRDLVEISFDDKSELLLGRFQAVDYFGDGSFYLVNAPGHAVGHICGLARTTPDTFVFMGGDICHHAGQIRPTEYLPLPEHISPNPFKARGPPCPGSILLSAHPHGTSTAPFYRVASGGYYDDAEESQKTLGKLEELDGHPNILTIIAHDDTLLDILDFYPKTINDWRAKGYKEQGMWQFVRDFRDAIKPE